MDKRVLGFGAAAVCIMLAMNIALSVIFQIDVLAVWSYTFAALFIPYSMIRLHIAERKLKDARATSEVAFTPNIGFHAKL